MDYIVSFAAKKEADMKKKLLYLFSFVSAIILFLIAITIHSSAKVEELFVGAICVFVLFMSLKALWKMPLKECLWLAFSVSLFMMFFASVVTVAPPGEIAMAILFCVCACVFIGSTVGLIWIRLRK